MPTINFDLLKQWFDQLVELSESDRVKFLREARDIDDDARRHLLQLLSADAQLIGQTARPAITVARGETADAAMIGQRIGVYVVDQSLGRGGMGSVFLAHRADGSIEQQVAIKIVRAVIARRLCVIGIGGTVEQQSRCLQICRGVLLRRQPVAEPARSPVLAPSILTLCLGVVPTPIARGELADIDPVRRVPGVQPIDDANAGRACADRESTACTVQLRRV